MAKVQGKRVSKRLMLFLEAYKGAAQRNGVEAARIAGYRDPAKAFGEIKGAYGKLIAEADEEWKQSLILSEHDIWNNISNLVRSPNHRDHFKAIELAAKIKGMLDTKVTIHTDRAGLMQELDQLVAVLVGARALDRGLTVEATEVKVLPSGPSEPSK